MNADGESGNLSQGGVIGGSLQVDGLADFSDALTVQGLLTAQTNTIIEGDLTVKGTTIIQDEVEIKDPIMEVAIENTVSDAINSGWTTTYNDGANQLYAGVIREKAGDLHVFQDKIGKPSPNDVSVPKTGNMKLNNLEVNGATNYPSELDIQRNGTPILDTTTVATRLKDPTGQIRFAATTSSVDINSAGGTNYARFGDTGFFFKNGGITKISCDDTSSKINNELGTIGVTVDSTNTTIEKPKISHGVNSYSLPADNTGFSEGDVLTFNGSGDLEITTPVAGGDVIGTTISLVNQIPLYSDATGKNIKNSSITIDGAGSDEIAGVKEISFPSDIDLKVGVNSVISTNILDLTMKGNSQARIQVGGADKILCTGSKIDLKDDVAVESQIDTIGATTLVLGNANATAVNLAQSGVLTTVKGQAKVDDTLDVLNGLTLGFGVDGYTFPVDNTTASDGYVLKYNSGTKELEFKEDNAGGDTIAPATNDDLRLALWDGVDSKTLKESDIRISGRNIQAQDNTLAWKNRMSFNTAENAMYAPNGNQFITTAGNLVRLKCLNNVAVNSVRMEFNTTATKFKGKSGSDVMVMTDDALTIQSGKEISFSVNGIIKANGNDLLCTSGSVLDLHNSVLGELVLSNGATGTRLYESGDLKIDIQPTVTLLKDTCTFEKGITMNSTAHLFKPPSLTTIQRDATSPVNGSVCYNTDDSVLQFYNGSWVNAEGGDTGNIVFSGATIKPDNSTEICVKSFNDNFKFCATDSLAGISANNTYIIRGEGSFIQGNIPSTNKEWMFANTTNTKLFTNGQLILSHRTTQEDVKFFKYNGLTDQNYFYIQKNRTALSENDTGGVLRERLVLDNNTTVLKDQNGSTAITIDDTNVLVEDQLNAKKDIAVQNATWSGKVGGSTFTLLADVQGTTTIAQPEIDLFATLSWTGSRTIPANFLAVGSHLHIKLGGWIQSDNDACQLKLEFQFGNTVPRATSNLGRIAKDGLIYRGWEAEIDIFIRSIGVSATAVLNGQLCVEFDPATEQKSNYNGFMIKSGTQLDSTTTFDSTVAQQLHIWQTWADNDSTKDIICNTCSITVTK